MVRLIIAAKTVICAISRGRASSSAVLSSSVPPRSLPDLRLAFEPFDPPQHLAPNSGGIVLTFGVEPVDLEGGMKRSSSGAILALDRQSAGPELLIARHRQMMFN